MCAGFRPEKDIPKSADVTCEDNCIFSAKPRILIWNYEEGKQ
jgi:hypothetical protein